MIGVDLFSGAGGMSIGAKLAGVNVLLAVEKDYHASMTYQHNHPKSTVINDDIRNLDSLGSFGSQKELVLFAGLPCKGFSTSNQINRHKLNENNQLYKEFFKFVPNLLPDWVVIENVPGMLQTTDGYFFAEIVKKLNENGYKESVWILNSLDFGIPQKRKRLFIVGSRRGLSLSPPKPTNSKSVTVEDALNDLPSLPNGANENWMPYNNLPPSKYARKLRNGNHECANNLVTKSSDNIIQRYRHIPPGGNWQNIPIELLDSYLDITKCHTLIYHRLDPKKHSIVIGNYRKNMIVHPFEDRGLSVREAARLQSFPDDFEFRGSIGFQQEQVGNAVPPLLAKAVFSHIIRKSND